MKLPQVHPVPGSGSGLVFVLGIALVLFAAPLSGQAQTLLVGWTFNNQTTQTTALTADEGTLAGTAFTAVAGGGSGNTITLNGDGTISLGLGEVLYSSAINSTAYSSLLSNVTIYVRFTLTSTATAVNSAVYGFTTATPPYTGNGFQGTGGGGSFGYEVNSNSTTPTVRTTGTTSSGVAIGDNSGFNSIAVGTQDSTAVDFNSTGTSYSYFNSTNGTMVSRGPVTSTDTLAAFTDFAIGRLAQGGSEGATTIDEIRIYEGNLTAAQLSAIPEPGTTAWLCAGFALLALPVLRKFRGASPL